MKNPIRFVRTACLLAALAAGGTVPVTSSVADRMSPERTNPRHLSRVAEKPKWRMKRVTVVKKTIYENPRKAGLLFMDSRPMRQVVELDQTATDACRVGQFRRFGGGFVRIGGEVYRAARARDIRGPKNVGAQDGIYVFKREGSTRCTVYLADKR
jgi:hypothetical protein